MPFPFSQKPSKCQHLLFCQSVSTNAKIFSLLYCSEKKKQQILSCFVYLFDKDISECIKLLKEEITHSVYRWKVELKAKKLTITQFSTFKVSSDLDVLVLLAYQTITDTSESIQRLSCANVKHFRCYYPINVICSHNGSFPTNIA